MLHTFLATHREELIARCRSKVGARSHRRSGDALPHGISLFIDQLVEALRLEETSHPNDSELISGPSGGRPVPSVMGESATLHARELLSNGYTVDEVVHDYGDLCQAVTSLAFEQGCAIDTDEFRTFNRCLDNVIAVAVAEFAHQRETASAERHAVEMSERLGFLAHELRNHLTTATLAFELIQSGKVAVSGATGAVLSRSLVGLRTLIDSSLAEVRISAGLPVTPHVFLLEAFIAEVRLSSTLEANLRGCVLTTLESPEDLAIAGDRDLLMAAVGNLLQNAFKFTLPQTEVRLQTYAVEGRVYIDVSDHCGGLPAGVAERLFTPFVQAGADRSGVGLGLSISRRSVEANGGKLSVRNVPGVGCVFSVDLPRHAMPVRGDALEAVVAS